MKYMLENDARQAVGGVNVVVNAPTDMLRVQREINGDKEREKGRWQVSSFNLAIMSANCGTVVGCWARLKYPSITSDCCPGTRRSQLRQVTYWPVFVASPAIPVPKSDRNAHRRANI